MEPPCTFIVLSHKQWLRLILSCLIVFVMFIWYIIHRTLSLEKLSHVTTNPISDYSSFVSHNWWQIMRDFSFYANSFSILFGWTFFWIIGPMIKNSNWVYYIFHWKNYLMFQGVLFILRWIPILYKIRSQIIIDMCCCCRSLSSCQKIVDSMELVSSDGFYDLDQLSR